VNPDEFAALRERLRERTFHERPEIRLCCPLGHFITAVTLLVSTPEEWDQLGAGQAILFAKVSNRGPQSIPLANNQQIQARHGRQW
jgi:hypothetical protein